MAHLDPDDVRAEVRGWIADHWDPELSLLEWRRQLVEAGWAVPSWPGAWGGRDLPAALAEVAAEELARAGAPGVADGVGMHLAVPTLLEHGSDQLNHRLIPATVIGEITWCQLFSEPGAGSDLAGLTTRADRDGDTWLVNGQKVWNTSAHHADFGLLLARTDWDVPKHQGISYLVLPMHQPGVEVRPLRQMNGHASFNEVFLTDAEVPVDHLVGAEGGGWGVALTTLAHERRLAPGRVAGGRASTRDAAGPAGPTGRAVREAAAEQAVAAAPYTWYPQRAGRPDLVIEHARVAGLAHDPVVRQELARVITLARVAQWTQRRALAARALGRPPGPEGSLGKLASSNIARAAARAHSLIAGAGGLLNGPDSPFAGVVAEVLVSVPAVSIAGGTDEIQHNILGERILGLPKEPDPARQMPFHDVPRNASR